MEANDVILNLFRDQLSTKKSRVLIALNHWDCGENAFKILGEGSTGQLFEVSEKNRKTHKN